MLHNWIVVARTARGVVSETQCSHCKARAYGPNIPSAEGCTGPNNVANNHDRPDGNLLNRTHTRNNF